MKNDEKPSILTYGFGPHTVKVAPIDDEWAVTIDAVLMGVCKCPVSGLLAAKQHLGVRDEE